MTGKFVDYNTNNILRSKSFVVGIEYSKLATLLVVPNYCYILFMFFNNNDYFKIMKSYKEYDNGSVVRCL